MRAVKHERRRRERIFRRSAAYAMRFSSHGLRPWLRSVAAARLNKGAASPRLFTTALLGLLEPIEQASCIGSSERFESMWLALFDGIARDCSFGAKKFRFLLHLAMPHIFVQLTDVHEHAHL